MKGIVFNLLEEVVTADLGADAWFELVEASAVSGVYTSVGSYPDEDLYKLVEVASQGLGLSPDEILRDFGRKAMPLLAARYGALFSGHEHSRSFILSVNDIIHPEVRKLYSGAACPHFHFQQGANGRLMVGYRSPRNLCQLAHGFVHGAADHFGNEVEITHDLCMKDGDPICRMALEWSR
ncbi:heme NO-binding domain-containing protein [Croceicoccus bisphenolivorans]|uniref:heme NO-binding domain-containing protein n=1 Tax=Croceicoccus bisphenolivorans TaxID=1783232 RepID=UPI00082B3EAA|nr:heme NO-binding domain-containing protein [Croceicoccus bisphenolivorans]